MVYNTGGGFTISGNVYSNCNIIPAPGCDPQAAKQMPQQPHPASSTPTTSSMPTPTPTPLTRMDVPHNPPSEPLNDRITFNHGIFDAAARSLTEIRAMIEVVHEMMEKQILCSSKDLLKTLASLKQIFRLTDLVLRAYQDTPLLKHISSVISMEAGDCRKLLEDLMVNLSSYLCILSPKIFHFIRNYVWIGIGRARAHAIDSKLRACHRWFAVCLIALDR